MRLILLLIHAGVSAMWMGAMGYSLFVVQPKLGRMAGGDPERLEQMQRELAHGNRWPVTGLIGVLWLSGIGLVAIAPGDWVVVGVKAAALAVASILFWWVSWRAWPRRVFALPAELPGLQRQFTRVAQTMFGLVALAFVLGVL